LNIANARKMVQWLGPNSPDEIKKIHVGGGPHAIMADWWNVIGRFDLAMGQCKYRRPLQE
jgi:hypothetical protein